MEMLRENYRDLYSFAFRMLGSREQAEDIVQEAFFRWKHKNPNLPDAIAVRRWLFVVTRNLCIDFTRGKPNTSETSADELFDLQTPNPNPSESAMDTERERMVQRAVQALPPAMREMVILREYEQMSYEEIAKVVGCPLGTVRSRLAKARDALRIRLQHYLED